MRLAWLIAKLRLDAPIYSETIHGRRLPLVAALSMIPATLQAAEVVELARFSPQSVERAIEIWNVSTVDLKSTATTVCQWWEIYRRDRPRWAVAMAYISASVAACVLAAWAGHRVGLVDGVVE